jgi:omega-amidase
MNLTVSIAQMRVAVSQPEENLSKAERWIVEASRRGSDIICFPEMWTTGFNWKNNDRMATEHHRIVDRVAGMAKTYGIWINGSMLALNEAGNVSNTSFLFNADGETAGTYRKTHLFTLLHEDAHMAAGEHLTVVDTPWARVGLAICYDIRFPEMFRTYALKGVEIVFCPMAFPYPRLDHWKILVRARAIENQMFVAGINQVGSEDFGPDGVVTYFGDSVIIDPWGRTVIEAGETDEMLLTATLNMDRVKEIRATMTVLKDRRPDLYELWDDY